MQDTNKARGQQMKVSKLARESGMAPSAIQYYVRLGVLQPPNKAGLNLQLYDETHLSRLRQIRQLKEKKGLSLAEIRQIVTQGKPGVKSDPLPDAKRRSRHPVETSVRDKQKETERNERKNKEKILDMAIKLFSERGYENTKVSDITDALRMGRATFYVYFKNKRELFMDCIDRFGVAIVPRESWEDISREHDFLDKNKKRGVAFLKAFPGYRGILNVVRGAIGGRETVLAQKAVEALRVLSRPMLQDLRKAIADDNVWIKHDEVFIAYMLVVFGEGLGYWQMIDPRYSVEEAIDIITDIIEHGLIHRSPPQHGPAARQGPTAEIEHGRGRHTAVEDISIAGEYTLRGRMEEAEVDADLGRLAVVRFVEKKGLLLGELTTKDGKQLEMEVDPGIHLSGMTPFGHIQIPLKQIRSISFGNEPGARNESS